MTGRILYDEPEASYHRRHLDVASNSGLKILDEKSPAHYWHWCQYPEEDRNTAALDFGAAFHAAVLEPDAFARRYCVTPADAPARPTIRQVHAKKPSPATLEQIAWWQRWDADHTGLTMLAADDYDTIQGMAAKQRDQVLQVPDRGGKLIKIRGSELFDLCQKEVTLRWTDPRTGVECKARVDLACAELRFGGDLKSAVDASPDGFARAVHRYRYHQQDAHYMDGADACGAPWDTFLFFASEKTKPYEPGVYYVPPVARERGRVLRDRALATLKTCLDSGRWPGYTPTITELILPAYAYYDERS